MGILDTMNDPMMSLGMGLLSASGPSARPIGVGQGLGMGMQEMQRQQMLNEKRKQMDMHNQMGQMQMEQMRGAMAQQQQRMQALKVFRSQLPAPLQNQFDIDPEGFIKQMMKQEEEYTLTPGAARFKGGQQIAVAPPDPNKMSRKEELEYQSQLRKDEREFAARLAASNRQPEAPNLVQVDDNGTPKYVPARQAIGMKPWNDKNSAGPQKGSPEKRAQEAQMALPVIEQAEALLDKATGSYLGSGVDTVARAFGASTKGAQAAAQLKILEAQLIQNMPRMEGPQSDKDVQLYKQAAAQIGDDTVPTQTKRAALNTLRDIQSRYAGMATGGQAASGVIDFNKLRK